MGFLKKFPLLFLVFNLGIIILMWYSGSANLLKSFPNFFLAIGQLAGLLTVVAVLTQFLLIGRIKWIEPFYGHDKLARYHQYNGKYIIFPLLLTHVIFITLYYSMMGHMSFIGQILNFAFQWEDLLDAIIGFLLFIGVIALSITIVRRHLRYEFWYLTHLFVYVAIIFAFGHQLEWGGNFTNNAYVLYWFALYGFVGINVAWFRFIKPWMIFFKHQFKVEKIFKETSDVTSIYITGNHMESFRVQPGQFFIFRFLDWKRWWQAHPFSLSRPTNGKDIRITPKNSGDFTAELSSVKPGTFVYIDGPHGIFTEKTSHLNKYLLIAGGIGITPIRSLLEQFIKEKKDVMFLYSNKTKQDVVFEKELEELHKKHAFTMINILTQEKNWKGETGRIDEEKIKKLVPDFKHRDIYICGPIPMLDALHKVFIKLRVHKNQIHYEKFEF